MKSGPSIVDAKIGEAFKVVVGSLPRRLRKGSVYTYSIGDELLLWKKVGSKWKVRRVIYKASMHLANGNFERAPYCPKCLVYLLDKTHDCNHCHESNQGPIKPNYSPKQDGHKPFIRASIG